MKNPIKPDRIAYKQSDLYKSLLFDLPLVEKGGSTVRDFARGRSNTLTNSPTYSVGSVGRQLDFSSASSQYLLTSNLRSIWGDIGGKNFTLMAMIKLNGTAVQTVLGFIQSGGLALICRVNCYTGDTQATGRLQLLIRSTGGTSLQGGVNSDTGINDGLYHTIFWGRNGPTTQFFNVDGKDQPISYITSSNAALSSPGYDPLIAGRAINTGVKDSFINGSLACFRIFSKALTSSEMRQLSADPWMLYQ